MKIEELSIDAIKPYEKNPRKNDGAVNGVAESIKQFGFQQPIVIDKNGVIVAGHTRYKAALQLGMKTVPCVRADQLTPKQVKAYRILDNKLNELATWDFAALGEEMKSFEFNFDGFDVALPTLSINEFFDEPSTSEQRTTDNDSTVPNNGTLASPAQTGEPIQARGDSYSYISGSEGDSETFRLLVEFESEEDQNELLERLTSEGYAVRIL